MKAPILIPNIFNHPFTYDSDLNLKVGDYVVVPFGKSEVTGVVWDDFEKKTNKKFAIKKVLRKLDVPSLKKNTIKFLNWVILYSENQFKNLIIFFFSDGTSNSLKTFLIAKFLFVFF